MEEYSTKKNRVKTKSGIPNIEIPNTITLRLIFLVIAGNILLIVLFKSLITYAKVLFFVFCMFMIGSAFLKSKIRDFNVIEFIACSIMVGIAVFIILFFAFESIGLLRTTSFVLLLVIAIVSGIMSIPVIVNAVKKSNLKNERENNHENCRNTEHLQYIFLLAIFLFSVFLISDSLIISSDGVYLKDALHPLYESSISGYTENIVNADDLSYIGKEMKYHFGIAFIINTLHEGLKIPLLIVLYRIIPIIILGLAVVVVFFLFQRFGLGKYAIYTLFFLFFCSLSIVYPYTSLNWLPRLTGMGSYGFAMLLVAVYLIFELQESLRQSTLPKSSQSSYLPESQPSYVPSSQPEAISRNICFIKVIILTAIAMTKATFFIPLVITITAIPLVQLAHYGAQQLFLKKLHSGPHNRSHNRLRNRLRNRSHNRSHSKSHSPDHKKTEKRVWVRTWYSLLIALLMVLPGALYIYFFLASAHSHNIWVLFPGFYFVNLQNKMLIPVLSFVYTALALFGIALIVFCVAAYKPVVNALSNLFSKTSSSSKTKLFSKSDRFSMPFKSIRTSFNAMLKAIVKVIAFSLKVIAFSQFSFFYIYLIIGIIMAVFLVELTELNNMQFLIGPYLVLIAVLFTQLLRVTRAAEHLKSKYSKNTKFSRNAKKGGKKANNFIRANSLIPAALMIVFVIVILLSASVNILWNEFSKRPFDLDKTDNIVTEAKVRLNHFLLGIAEDYLPGAGKILNSYKSDKRQKFANWHYYNNDLLGAMDYLREETDKKTVVVFARHYEFDNNFGASSWYPSDFIRTGLGRRQAVIENSKYKGLLMQDDFINRTKETMLLYNAITIKETRSWKYSSFFISNLPSRHVLEDDINKKQPKNFFGVYNEFYYELKRYAEYLESASLSSEEKTAIVTGFFLKYNVSCILFEDNEKPDEQLLLSLNITKKYDSETTAVFCRFN